MVFHSPTASSARPSAQRDADRRTESSMASRPRPEPIETDTVVGSIRFVPHVEFSARVSLNFEPMERKVCGDTHIKIGRYNEKSNNVTAVTFKSKVVSRLHAEIWCENGIWFIKDAKSSSGTFLNHIRLSPPGHESMPTPLADGDSVQFGIDFRGGTEEVYRSVRTKVEINRVFQRQNDKFNQSAHKKLKNLTSAAPLTPSRENPTGLSEKMDDSASTYTAECCICLFAIAPSQALFVAPCSHAYHFKCIRPLILQQYPNFLCCVCRKYADLEASVEVESEAWIRSLANNDPRTPTTEQEEPVFLPIEAVLAPSARPGSPAVSRSGEGTSGRPVPPASPTRTDNTQPVTIMNRLLGDLHLDRQDTPRNNAGPFLIDGTLG